jgi:hypothetical protein
MMIAKDEGGLETQAPLAAANARGVAGRSNALPGKSETAISAHLYLRYVPNEKIVAI